MARLVSTETYGRVENIAYRCSYGGWMNILNRNATSGATNISEGDGCQVLQGTILWDGTSKTESNDNNLDNIDSEILN